MNECARTASPSTPSINTTESLNSSVVSSLTTAAELSPAQEAAVEYCLDHDHVLLIADKGAGKTRTGLVVAHETEGRTLILCPNKVRSAWCVEGHKLGIDVYVADGTPARRLCVLDNKDCKIVVVGVDLIPWLIDHYRGEVPFEGLILDETTRFSSPGSAGVRKLRRAHKHLTWVLGLTASPVMENPLALYGQALVIDGGRALGRNYDTFKQTYFIATDFQQRDWALRPGAAEIIADEVSELIYHMEDRAYEDSLVPLVEEVVPVPVPPSFYATYERLAEEQYLELGGAEIEAANLAVLSGKLEQLCQGAVYDEDGGTQRHNNYKMDTLLRLVADEPVIICYQYKFELTQLRAVFPYGRDLKDAGALEAFNGGGLDILFMHPKSGSHGINAQERCCEMIMLKPIWSADGWDQVIGRIRRRGQTRPCRRRTLVISGTVDEVILTRVEGKEDTGSALLDHIKAACK
jgi:hypothetical protein